MMPPGIRCLAAYNLGGFLVFRHGRLVKSLVEVFP